MRRRRLAVASVAALLLGSRCGPRASRHPEIVLHPVARVEGEVISAEEVALVARAEALGPREALDRLIAERLLAREGRRRGLVTPDDEEGAKWRAMVQRHVQREVEERWTIRSIPEPVFRATFERRRVQFIHDGLVRAVHALVRAEGGGAARAQALRRAQAFRARVLAETGGHPTPERFEQAAHAEPGVTFEALEAFDRTGATPGGASYHEAFVRAAWALDDVHTVSEPVETPFGYHVILRVGAVPPLRRPFEEVRAIIQRDTLQARRKKALDDLLAELRARYGVELSDSTLEGAAESGQRRGGSP